MNISILGPIRRHKLVTGLIALIVVPILAISLWTAFSLRYAYSTGTRAGVLQKISQRGWLCKTWEGELMMTPVPGAAPEKFLFTTRSDSIAQVLTSLSGKNVALEYAQHVHVPSSCFGDTEYFVTAVRAVTP